MRYIIIDYEYFILYEIYNYKYKLLIIFVIFFWNFNIYIFFCKILKYIFFSDKFVYIFILGSKPWGRPWGTQGNNSGGWHTYHQKQATGGKNHMRKNERRMKLRYWPNHGSVSKREGPLSLSESPWEDASAQVGRVCIQKKWPRRSFLFLLGDVPSWRSPDGAVFI